MHCYQDGGSKDIYTPPTAAIPTSKPFHVLAVLAGMPVHTLQLLGDTPDWSMHCNSELGAGGSE
jgi:hypothetical protein